MNKQKATNLFLTVTITLVTVFISSLTTAAQTSTQNFGTGTGSQTSQTGSTAFIPAPTSGTTYARGGATAPNAPIVLANTSNPLGTTDSYVRAVASSSASVAKFSPIVAYTAGSTFYTSFRALFGDSTGGTTAADGTWSFYQGSGAIYSNANDFSTAQVFTGLRFTYAAGAVNITYRNGSAFTNVGLTPNALNQGTAYNFQIFGNNSGVTVNYNFGGVAQTVPNQTFDLYLNGTIIGNDLPTTGFTGTNIDSITFIGLSSTNNAANIFVDNVITYNSIPVTLNAPTAAPISISGKVTMPRKLGANAAFVTLTDYQGNSRTIRTNRLGGFQFTEVAAGETYILSVQSKFAAYTTQVVMATQDITELNFVPIE